MAFLASQTAPLRVGKAFSGSRLTHGAFASPRVYSQVPVRASAGQGTDETRTVPAARNVGMLAAGLFAAAQICSVSPSHARLATQQNLVLASTAQLEMTLADATFNQPRDRPVEEKEQKNPIGEALGGKGGLTGKAQVDDNAFGRNSAQKQNRIDARQPFVGLGSKEERGQEFGGTASATPEDSKAPGRS